LRKNIDGTRIFVNSPGFTNKKVTFLGTPPICHEIAKNIDRAVITLMWVT